MIKIPAEPALGGHLTLDDRKALLKSFDESGDLRNGFRAHDAEAALEKKAISTFGYGHAIALSSGGVATDLVLKAIGAGPGMEVISAAATFHGQHLSVLGTGATLRLCDVDPKTLCLSPAAVSVRLSRRTGAVIATDLHGAEADYESIRHEITKWSLKSGCRPPILIGDAARSVPFYSQGTRNAQPDILILSMQSKKIWTSLGEGALVLTNSQQTASLLRQYRSFGLGSAWGSNFKLSKLQATVALTQLKNVQKVIEARRSIAHTRINSLRRILPNCTVVSGTNIRHCFSFFCILLPNSINRCARDELIERLAIDYGVGTVVANPPTYLYNDWINAKTTDRCIETEKITDRIICLPIHQSFSRNEEKLILHSFVSSFKSINRGA